MQKKLIALAVAGLASTGAFAQSNVQVYGLMDLGLQHLTSSGQSAVNRIGQMSSNLWGLKGTEDLGNGLKAGFVLEGGLNNDVGTAAVGGKLFGRQSYLSLSGNFGTGLVGRFNTFGRANIVKYSASPLSGVDGLGLLASAAGMTISGNGIDADATGARLSNAVGYVSPSFSGVTVGFAHSFAETVPGANNASYNTTIAANSYNVNELWVGYANGPLSVDYVYNKVGAIATGAGGSFSATTGAFTAPAQAATLNAIGGVEEHFLAGGYDFGSFKLLGSYQTRKSQVSSTDKVFNVGALIPVTAAGKISVSYAKLSMDSTLKGTAALAAGGIGLLPTSGVLGDANATALGYYHSLSKRTTAYATWTRVSNSNGGTIGFTNVAATNPTAGGSSNLTSVGLQHAF